MKNTIKVDALKRKIKKLLGYASADRAGMGHSNTGWLDNSAFAALAHLAMNVDSYVLQERPALVAFAKHYPSTPDDTLANAAKATADKPMCIGKAANELSLLALKAREEACKLVDNWDVRAIARLIALFPDVISKKQRTANISLFMADNANADWMISFN